MKQRMTAIVVRLCKMYKFNADDFAHSTSFVADAFSHFGTSKIVRHKIDDGDDEDEIPRQIDAHGTK